jgi:hypothetical protein
MTTKPKTRKAAAPARKPAAIDDPIFGLIAEHKALTRKYFRLQYKLDDAESKAAETHGKRPFEMTLWRGCDAFSEEGIDARREEFLSQPGVDREQIEKEYVDAKARLAAAESASAEWDHRAGVAPLREQYESAHLAERKAAMRMARTKPATLAGAAALVDYARRDINIGKNTTGWPKIALKTVSTALAGMKGCRMNRHVRLRYGNNMNEDTQSALSRLIRDR